MSKKVNLHLPWNNSLFARNTLALDSVSFSCSSWPICKNRNVNAVEDFCHQVTYIFAIDSLLISYRSRTILLKYLAIIGIVYSLKFVFFLIAAF